jgi:hypothetical protein
VVDVGVAALLIVLAVLFGIGIALWAVGVGRDE